MVDVYTCGRVSMGSDVSRAACKEMNAPRLTANATQNINCVRGSDPYKGFKVGSRAVLLVELCLCIERL